MFLTCWGIGRSQSLQLKDAFDQVNRTLKEFKFYSQDVEASGDEGRTRNIQVVIMNGNFGILIFDDFGDFADPFFGFKHGNKALFVPLNNVSFGINSSELIIRSDFEDDVLFIYDNQKEILNSYSLFGTEGNIRKLKRELEFLTTVAVEENFNEDLGIPSRQQSTKKKTKSKRKK